jgi:hypothetical protein
VSPRTKRTAAVKTARFALIDRYVLRLTLWPMVACLGVTMLSLLLARSLRLLDLLSQSSDRFGPVVQLAANLFPHYLGLALPIAFFVALFIVITKLDDGSEVEALLANGVSLTRLAAPYLALGVILMSISLVVFGYLQPYSRYAYRAVLHAAVNAGWDGRLHGGAFVSDGDTVMTADSASLEGRRLQRLFIRRPVNGGEEVITAGSAQLVMRPDGKHVSLVLKDGLRVGESKGGSIDMLSFDTFVMQTSLSGAAALMRARGERPVSHRPARAADVGVLRADRAVRGHPLPAADRLPAGARRETQPQGRRPDPRRGAHAGLSKRPAVRGKPRRRRQGPGAAVDRNAVLRLHRLLHLDVPGQPAPSRRDPHLQVRGRHRRVPRELLEDVAHPAER